MVTVVYTDSAAAVGPPVGLAQARPNYGFESLLFLALKRLNNYSKLTVEARLTVSLHVC